MPVLSKTDAAVLGMLTIEPMTGYEMKRFSEQSLANFWHESYGNLYPRLGRLARAGFIRGRREQRPRGPAAVIYTLTDRGRRAFLDWLREPPDDEQVRSELMLKVFFGAELPADVTRARILEYRRQQLALRRNYRAIRALIDADADGPPRQEVPHWLMTLRRGELLTDARLRWCREALAMLEAREPPRRRVPPRREGGT